MVANIAQVPSTSNHESINGGVNPPPTDTSTNCSFADQIVKSPFRVLSQVVHISHVDFRRRTFRLSTELSVIAVCADVPCIVLDLGKDCVLPNESAFEGSDCGRVTVNGHSAHYARNRFGVPLSESTPEKSASNLKRTFKQCISSYKGDLLIEIPRECASDVEEQKVLKVAIDVFVLAPHEEAENGESAEVGSHMYTYRSNLLSSTKEWLPCLSSTNQLAVWRFEIRVESKYTAICCGDLIDTITTHQDDGPQRTFHYQLLIPTSAVNIGFVIGDFQHHVLPDIPEIVSFTLPGLMPLLKHTVSSMDRTYTYFEELLSCRYPYGFYRQVFVDQIPDEVTTFAGLSLFSINLLYHKKILDMVRHTREILALAIAQQFFGCFVNPADFSELWLVKSLARFITGLFVERTFGLSEYMFKMHVMLKSFCEYEDKHGKIVLTPPSPTFTSRSSTDPLGYLSFDSTRAETCSPLYAQALFDKGHFLMRILQKKLSPDQFIKVLHRILSVAAQYSQALTRPIDWFHLLISTDSFFRTVTNITSREFPSFIEQWINTGGHIEFQVFSTFNRKQNKLELEIRQDVSANAPGLQNYIGQLKIGVQEFDGYYTHDIQVDASISKHDLQCHSKGRRLKKKRVPISTNEEVDIDLSQMDADSPVLWIRIDPDMQIPRKFRLNQTPHQWECMLRHERDVIAQMDALDALLKYPVHTTKTPLLDVIENPRFFYRVRAKAAHCLVDVCNRLPEAMMADVQSPLVELFQRLYGSKSDPSLPPMNNYAATSSNLQQYFLSLELPLAIAKTRANGGRTCPQDVLNFLMDLVRLNDNSVNRYSDDFYRAALIKALGEAVVMREHVTEQPTPETLSAEASRILAEVTHALNMDTMKPSFGRVVGIECLRAILIVQRMRHIQPSIEIFWKFAECGGVYSPMRKAAFECIILSIRKSRQPECLESAIRLIDVALRDEDPFIRYGVVELLNSFPPFHVSDEDYLHYSVNCKEVANRLWSAVSDPKTENRIRTMLSDLYVTMYGFRETPLALKR